MKKPAKTKPPARDRPKATNVRRLRRTRRGEDTRTIPDRRAIDPPKNVKVAVGVIDDPYGSPEGMKYKPHARRDGTVSEEGEWQSPGQPKIVVLRSIRADPLGWMHSHRQIDEAEYLAGRRWQALYERSHIGSVQAIDTSKEPVDGGQFSEPLSDRQRVAMDQLRGAAAALVASVPDKARGIGRARLIQDVLGDGMFIKMAASARGITGERPIRALAKEFYQSLSALADHFGYAGGSKSTRQKIRGWHAAGEEEGRQENREEEGQP